MSGHGQPQLCQDGLLNEIGEALANRIGRAIDEKRPFHVYMALPARPEGALSVPNIRHQVGLTMQSLVFGEHSLIRRISHPSGLAGWPACSEVKTPVEGSTTPRTTYWWRLDGQFADENGNPIDGWLAEQELITTRHSPWEWPGFQWIEDTGTPLEKLAYTFNAKGLLSADEQHNYRAQISKADGGPLMTLARLYEIVDTNEDGVLTGDEMRAALEKPWQAQVLGQLITRYESE